MRVRITTALTRSIDGIQLARLVKGQVYDVNTSLACYLLSEKMAEPAISEQSPAPIEKSPVHREPQSRRAPVVPRSIAADRRQRTKRKEHS
jgi:hypothetical protein